MASSARRAAVRAVPGPVGLALWIAACVLLPLLVVDLRGAATPADRPETRAMLHWTLGALPVLGAVVGVRFAVRQRGTPMASPRHPALVALAAGTVAGCGYEAVSLATYSWIIPPRGPAGWACLLGPPLAGAGALLGYALAPALADAPDPGTVRTRRRYLFGVLVMLVGLASAPWLVRTGGRVATTRYPGSTYLAGPRAASGPTELALPAAGGYGLFDTAGTPAAAHRCQVTGAGATTRPAAVTIPLEYGDDAAYTWVATFTVPAPGAYTLTCPGGARYEVADVPPVRGLVGRLVSAPLALIWLFGALPGLLIAAHAATRRAACRRSRPDPATPVGRGHPR